MKKIISIDITDADVLQFTRNIVQKQRLLIQFPVLATLEKLNLYDHAKNHYRKIYGEDPSEAIKGKLREILAVLPDVAIKLHHELVETIESDAPKLVELIMEIIGEQFNPGKVDQVIVEDISAVTKTYKELEKRIKGEHPTFNARKPTLFYWCHVMIKDLVLAALKPLFPKDDATQTKIDTLLRIALKIVLFDTLVDDISDNIQIKELLEKFTGIPTFTEEELAKASAFIGEYKGGTFKEYFELTVRLWNEIKNGLCELLDTKELPHEFSELIGDLMETMHYSLAMNQSPTLPDDYQTMESKLSSNMMVRILFMMQLSLLKKITGITFTEKIETLLKELVEIMEKSFHHANCFASHKREAEENDKTNSLFMVAKDIYINEHLQFIKFGNAKATFTHYLLEKEGFTELHDIINEVKPESYEQLLQKVLDKDLDEKRKTLLIALNSHSTVIHTYFKLCWRMKNKEITQKVGELKTAIDDPEFKCDQKEQLEECIRQLEQVNRVFLESYLVFAKIKGAT